MTLSIRPRREGLARFSPRRLFGDRSPVDAIDVGELQDKAGEVQSRVGEGIATIGKELAARTDEVGKAVGAGLDDLRDRLPDKLPDKINMDRFSLDRVPRIRIERRPTMADRLRSAFGTGILAAAAVGVGAVLAFLFDPARGRARRMQARDRAAALVRRAGRSLDRGTRIVGANVAGLRERVTHMGDEGEPPNDATLAHKVESILFRDPAVDKGRIDVNAEDGVVVLRGVADDLDQIRTLEMRAREIAGVEDVDNLLHLPGTPAPQAAPRYHAAAAVAAGVPGSASSAPVPAGVGGNNGLGSGEQPS